MGFGGKYWLIHWWVAVILDLIQYWFHLFVCLFIEALCLYFVSCLHNDSSFCVGFLCLDCTNRNRNHGNCYKWTNTNIGATVLSLWTHTNLRLRLLKKAGKIQTNHTDWLTLLLYAEIYFSPQTLDFAEGSDNLPLFLHVVSKSNTIQAITIVSEGLRCLLKISLREAQLSASKFPRLFWKTIFPGEWNKVTCVGV